MIEQNIKIEKNKRLSYERGNGKKEKYLGG
jgi:hypothetical protein